MKKLQNSELKQNSSSLKHVKEGKVNKSKQKISTKLKDIVGKKVDLQLAPIKLGSNFKKNDSDDRSKKKKKQIKIKNKSELQKVTENYESKQAMQKNQQESKDIKDKDENKTSSDGKSKAELKKIEKKKAKKLAMKLKKQQKKAQDIQKATTVTLNNEEKDKVKHIKKGVSEDLNKKYIPHVNGGEKSEKLETANDVKVDAISSGVLTKREKKALKTLLLKDKKPKTVGDENINATGNEALNRKGKKAIKSLITKDHKLETVEAHHVDVTSSAAVPKKGKNTIRSQIIDNQKLKTAENNKVDASNSKVLMKKEKKALKRQLTKDRTANEKQTRDPALEEATVFVGNLPVNTKRSQLQLAFKKFGPVHFIRLRSAGGKILYKHKQRKLAGSLNAYVVLQSKDKAEKALSLNGVEFKGNHLRVTLATQKPESQENGEARRTVFIGNLKYSASEESLREIFSSCGEIEYVRCIRDGDKGCKGVAYVCFKNADAVGLALELNETIVDERSIHVERFNVKKLGAKKAREAQAEKGTKHKTGAKLRLESKKDKSSHKLKIGDEITDAKKSKKSEFRGVKVQGLKKKQKSKKKKSNDQMLLLAKKIAPKSKNE